MKKELQYIFGPVNSSRIGKSLGIDVIPKKICSLDCIYCEVGITRNLSTQIKPYFKAEAILAEFSSVYHEIKDSIDVVTITGSGEPTLNSCLKDVLIGIRDIVKGEKEIAILTNTTTLDNKDVYKTLLDFDIVVPSLDAVTKTAFEKINKPAKEISINNIINCLIAFSNEYTGKLYLEVLLAKNINDLPEDINTLISVLKKINYTRLDIGTIIRPPSHSFAVSLTNKELEEVKSYIASQGVSFSKDKSVDDNLNNNTIINYSSSSSVVQGKNVAIEKLIPILKMRPTTLEDIIKTLKIDPVIADEILTPLLQSGEIISKEFNGVLYYQHKIIKQL